ncbi:Hypothetical predicted protein [Lynx pardinus]|uniref:Uncharacterized protein n=1 Tax=Lynx pardinus TaxID=191816 RepID=A0A485MVH1_LYNPA|nr:Hypothetical predicted protein [Lynx pardinus]
MYAARRGGELTALVFQAHGFVAPLKSPLAVLAVSNWCRSRKRCWGTQSSSYWLNADKSVLQKMDKSGGTKDAWQEFGDSVA